MLVDHMPWWLQGDTVLKRPSLRGTTPKASRGHRPAESLGVRDRRVRLRRPRLYVSAGLASGVGPRRLTAAMPKPLRRLPERDHADEDQADDQHACDDLLA